MWFLVFRRVEEAIARDEKCCTPINFHLSFNFTRSAIMDPQTKAGKSLWVEYTHQDGRKYYYHSATKQTVWQKPDELKSSKEVRNNTSSPTPLDQCRTAPYPFFSLQHTDKFANRYLS